jgi:DNA polymerase-3 subunit delta
MKLYPDKLNAALQQLRPVYLVAGPEILLREEAVDSIRATARKHGIAQRELMTADRSFSWDQLSATGATMSLFAERRLLELRLPTGKPGVAGAKAIGQWLQQAQADADVLLLIAEQWAFSNEKTAWVKKVDQAGIYVPVWNIKSAQLPVWIERRMRARQLQPETGVVPWLAARVDGSLLAAAQEIDKLLMANGAGTVTLDQVRAAVSDSSEYDAFKLCAAVWIGNLGLSMRIVTRLKLQGVVPQVLVATLQNELQTLYSFLHLTRSDSAQEAFRKLRIWESKQQVITRASKRLQVAQLEAAMIELATLDRIGKGQQYGDFWLQLERLILRLATPTPQHRAA